MKQAAQIKQPIVFAGLQEDASGFQLLSAKLQQLTGIHLIPSSKNKVLMASRLGPVLRTQGMDSYAQYMNYLNMGSSQAISEFISALTTNTTQFFREAKHFEILKTQLQSLLKQKEKLHKRELRLWCAASSTGQEVFTMAMVLSEVLAGLGIWDVRFLATDIDKAVLEKACEGCYTEAEAASIPALYRQKYLLAGPTPGTYRFRPELLRLIRFAPFNLLTPTYPFQHPFDVIFCRNVLIYFEAKTGQEVVTKLAKALAPGGFLFLGHSETSAMKTPLLTQLAPAAYTRKPLAKGTL